MALKSIAAAFMLVPIFTSAQQNQPEQLVEKYLEYTETQADYTQIAEDFSAYLTKPVSLNTASLDELLRFPLLSPAKAIAIVDHRARFGPILHLAELQVAGFSTAEIRLIQPYVTLKNSTAANWKEWKKSFAEGQFQGVLTGKQKWPVAIPDSAAGPSTFQTLRAKYAVPGKLSFGISADRDAGEAWWNKGPDFFSVHAGISEVGHLKQLVVGDYVAGFGQGLVMGSGIGMGKSAMVLSTRRNYNGIKPYRGVNEYQFLRGAAATFALKSLEITAAVALNKTDSRPADSSFTSASGLDYDGLHRNAAELANKWNSQRKFGGIWLRKNAARGYWGLGIAAFRYGDSLVYSDLYRQFYPTGKAVSFVHAFQAHTLGRHHFFSEWALIPEFMLHAISAGWLSTFGRHIETSVLFRNYQPGFSSPFSTAFGNASQNETGFYTGLRFYISHRINVSTYCDFWRNPWITYRVWSPSRSSDFFVQGDYNVSRKTVYYLRIRWFSKPYPVNNTEPVKRVDEQTIRNIRFHISTEINPRLSLQTRAEISVSKITEFSDQSSLLFLQVSSKGKIKVTARYTLFSVPWYYNRLYAFENQLPYEFSTTAFYGSGSELFVLARTRISRHWSGGIRTSLTSYTKTETPQAPNRSSVYLQISCNY